MKGIGLLVVMAFIILILVIFENRSCHDGGRCEGFSSEPQTIQVPMIGPEGNGPRSQTPMDPPSYTNVSTLPSAPIINLAQTNSLPYQDPALQKATAQMLNLLKQDMQGFSSFEAPYLKDRSDPAIQLPLMRFQGDFQRVKDEVSVLKKNPGLQSQLSIDDVDGMAANLRFLQRTYRVYADNQMVPPATAKLSSVCEGFSPGASSPSASRLSGFNPEGITNKRVYSTETQEGFQGNHCIPGYFINDDGECILNKGTQFYTGPPISNHCVEKYYMNDKGECILECPKGYVMNDQKQCIKVTGGGPGSVYTGPPLPEGNHCIPGYFINDDGECILNKGTQFYTGPPISNRCVQKYYMNDKGECILECPKGYVMSHENRCIKLIGGGPGSVYTGPPLTEPTPSPTSSPAAAYASAPAPASSYSPAGWVGGSPSAYTPCNKSDNPPITPDQLDLLSQKIAVEIVRLQASGATDPVIAARVAVFTKIKNTVDTIIKQVKSGALKPCDIPISINDYNNFLPALGCNSAGIGGLIANSGFSSLSSLFNAYDAGDISGSQLAGVLLDSYADTLLRGMSFDVNLSYTSDNAAKVAGVQSGSDVESCFSMGDKPCSGKGCSGKCSKKCRGSRNSDSFDSSYPVTADSARGAFEGQIRQLDLSSKNGVRPSITTPAEPGKFDWKERVMTIEQNVRNMGLNPDDYGFQKNSEYSADFSWRGYARMVCTRLATHHDPGVPVQVGCPPVSWKGWRN